MSRPKFVLALAHVVIGVLHVGFSPTVLQRILGCLLAIVGAVWAVHLFGDRKLAAGHVSRCGCPTCADHRDKVARGET